jgi:hypothetical protein
MADHRVHYDRTALVRSIVECTAPVQLITGPSGIGKTDLLDAASRAEADRIAPRPVSLRRSAGSLQRGLIQSLGEAVSLIAERQNVGERVGRYLSEAAHRLADKGLRDIAKVVGKELLAVVRGRLGESVGDAIGEYLTELKGSYDERLEARLTAAADPDVVDMLVGFAEEAASLLEGADIVLSLDNGDALDDQDMRILSDLVNELPQGVRMRIAFATDRQRQGHLDQLLASGVEETSVPALSEPEVAAWLAASGLSSAPASQIHRITDGYPLHLHDMIVHLSAGGMIEEAPLNEQFARRTRSSWNALEVPLAIAARRLAAFPEPMPPSLVGRFLGIDASAWAEIEARLWRSGIFSGPESGKRWFHEQRRRFVWNSILTDEERPALAEEAVDELRRQVNESGQVEFLAPLARAAVDASGLRSRDKGLDDVLALGRDELAVAAALLELSERPPGYAAVLGETLLNYAREAFTSGGDLVAALRSLEQRGLVHVASSERATAVVPRWSSSLALMVLGGRASAELGRLPVPSTASTFFQLELSPRLGSFNRAQYGLGRPSIAELSQQAVGLRRHSEDGTVRIVPPGPDLLITGYYAERPVYASVAFDTAEQRDAARQALAGLDVEVAGSRVRIDAAIDHPYVAVPSLRFIIAAELLLGKRLLRDSPRLKLSRPLNVKESLWRRLDALRVIRELSSDDERRAMGIEQSLGYMLEISSDGLSTLVAEVLCGREGVLQSAVRSTWSMTDPYAWFALASDAGLLPSERFGRIVVRGGEPSNEDPVIELFGELSNRASAYNRHADPLKIPLNETALAEALQAAEQRLDRDVVALASAVQLGEGTRAIAPRKTSLLVYPDSLPGFVPGYGTIAYLHMRSPSGAPEAAVHISTPAADPPTARQIEADFRTHLGITVNPDRPQWSWAASPAILAEMLGYARSEIRFATD